MIYPKVDPTLVTMNQFLSGIPKSASCREVVLTPEKSARVPIILISRYTHLRLMCSLHLLQVKRSKTCYSRSSLNMHRIKSITITNK